MSYDIELMINTGTRLHSVVDFNYTSNVYKMFQKAFKSDNGVNVLHEVPAATAVYLLRDAIKNMKSNPADYKLLNPNNNWGSYEGALSWLTEIYGACKEHPKCIVFIS